MTHMDIRPSTYICYSYRASSRVGMPNFAAVRRSSCFGGDSTHTRKTEIFLYIRFSGGQWHILLLCGDTWRTLSHEVAFSLATSPYKFILLDIWFFSFIFSFLIVTRLSDSATFTILFLTLSIGFTNTTQHEINLLQRIVFDIIDSTRRRSESAYIRQVNFVRNNGP